MTVDKDKLSRRVKQSTQPGPWKALRSAAGAWRVVDANGFWVCDVGEDPHQAKFIADAHPQAIEAVLAEFEGVSAQMREVWAQLDHRVDGQPFWSEPGLDDTTPGEAVAEVLKHYRDRIAAITEALRSANEQLKRAGCRPIEVPNRPSRPRPSGLSEEPCSDCGRRHRLGEFKPGTRVRTKVEKEGRIPIPAGTVCIVREWSQYCGPLYYRVHVEGNEQRRDNYSPCELEAAPVCSTCNDTHYMVLRGTDVMCTRCPVPCQDCRSGGNGPYCATTPCACDCHKRKVGA